MTGKELAEYAISKVGTSYFYGAKMEILSEYKMLWLHQHYPNVVTSAYIAKAKNKKQVGKINVDCSGLISAYTKKMLGSSQLYAQAKARMPISEWKKFAVGVVLWKKGHVGVYIGNGKVVEARGIDFGTIISNITATRWQYGLTFSWIDYEYADKADKIEHRLPNPYAEPEINIRKGMRGDAIKWLQWELNESGYDIEIDGIFGNKTLKALKAFQTSCKIEVDGICGKQTRMMLKAI